jgi:hypothetical protein
MAEPDYEEDKIREGSLPAALYRTYWSNCQAESSSDCGHYDDHLIADSPVFRHILVSLCRRYIQFP